MDYTTFLSTITLIFAIIINVSYSSIVSDLSIKCPYYVYGAPQHTNRLYKVYTWTRFGDKNSVITEALYYINSIGTRNYTVGVCYRFGGSDYGNPRDGVPTNIQKVIQKSCYTGNCHAGHLVPANMGGSNEPKNFIPQFASLNSGKWRGFESAIRDHDPITTIVAISVVYDYKKPSTLAPPDPDVPNLYYMQPTHLKIAWFSDDSKYLDTLMYQCAYVPNDSNDKNSVNLQAKLSVLLDPNNKTKNKLYNQCFK